MMPFVSTGLWWKLFPNQARDKCRFYANFIVVSTLWGTGMVCVAGRKDFREKVLQPSFFYRRHLKSLLKKGKIDEKRYNELLTGQVL